MASQEDVDQFVSITGSSPQVARGFLEMAAGDVMQAIQLFFEHPELQTSIATSTSSARPAGAASSRPARAGTNKDDAINVDSDDDADIAFESDDDIDDDDKAIRRAQEEEDARLAQKMQEDLYKQAPGGGAGGEDDVRAPIARTTETLVAPSGMPPEGGMASYMGAFGMAMDQDPNRSSIPPGGPDAQRRRQMQAARAVGGPFSQSMWDGEPIGSGDPNPHASVPVDTGALNQPSEGPRSRRLADLFRPPFDLICHLDWDDARSEGKDSQKWILVNLQDMSNFDCQALNRDIWKDPAIVDLIRDNFLFLQFSKDDNRASQYISFYLHNHSHENPDIYPHVSIIDPRTGEQVKAWSGRPFPSSKEFHEALVEFLGRYSLDIGSKNPVSKSKPPPKPRNIDAMTEDEMLEMALQASMATAGGSNGAEAGHSGSGGASGVSPDIHDPDALTRGTSVVRDAAGDDVMGEDAETSAFQRIASNKPHMEPAQNPETTTRIQFRHPTGRVIRRFGLNERVSRIYEWLKAEPMEGKEGVVFELKTSPQGNNLMDMIDETIGEAGLKQGTVMIEFIED